MRHVPFVPSTVVDAPVLPPKRQRADGFTTVPDAMHADQDEFLLANGYLAGADAG